MPDATVSLVWDVLRVEEGLPAQRLAIGAPSSLALWPFAGWRLTALCAGVLFTTQLTMTVFVRRIRPRDEPARPGRSTMLALQAWHAAGSLSYTTPAIALHFEGGLTGPVVVTLLLVGAGQHLWVHYGPAPSLVVVALVTHLGWLVVLPMICIAVLAPTGLAMCRHILSAVAGTAFAWHLALSTIQSRRFAAGLAGPTARPRRRRTPEAPARRRWSGAPTRRASC